MSNVRVNFSAGVRYGRLVAAAVADGLQAATRAAQGISTLGMTASGSVPSVVSKRSGIAYYPGPGAPLGGYPKLRSGQLERSMGVERARARGSNRITALFTASADYAVFVHGREGQPKRPFLLLPFQRNKRDIFDAFSKAMRRRLA